MNCFFYLCFAGLINTHRMRIEDRLTDLNNQPIDVRIYSVIKPIIIKSLLITRSILSFLVDYLKCSIH